MDTLDRTALEERVERNVRMILEEGDQAYLKGLSSDALLGVLEKELRFLGLYSYEDKESPKIIRDLLRDKLDHWSQKPTIRIQLQGSENLAWNFPSVAAGKPVIKQIVDFVPLQSPPPNTGNAVLLKAKSTQHRSFASK